jgi:hypothetical protein
MICLDIFIDHDNVKRWRHAESEDWGFLREMLKNHVAGLGDREC